MCGCVFGDPLEKGLAVTEQRRWRLGHLLSFARFRLDRRSGEELDALPKLGRERSRIQACIEVVQLLLELIALGVSARCPFLASDEIACQRCAVSGQSSPGVSAPVEGRLQLDDDDLQRARRGWRQQPQFRIGQVLPEQSRQGLRIELGMEGGTRQHQVGLMHLVAAIVRRCFPDRLLLVSHQLHIEQDAALKSAILQRALAKPMNRVDGDQVEDLKRISERTGSGLDPTLYTASQRAQERVFGRLAFQDSQRFAEPPPDPVAQLGGRRLGEGYDEYGARRDFLLEQQAQEKPRQGKGLAGAGAGLQPGHSLVEWRLNEVESHVSELRL